MVASVGTARRGVRHDIEYPSADPHLNKYEHRGGQITIASMRHRIFAGSAIVVVLIAAFLVGVADATFGLPPYPMIVQFYRDVHPARDGSAARYTIGDPAWLLTNPESLLHVGSAADAAVSRQFATEAVWGAETLPPLMPSLVEPGIDEPLITGLVGVRSVDRLTLVMPFGVDSLMYLIHPRNPNGRVILVHSGHDADARHWSAAISFFVGRGYEVAAISMPLFGPNSRPTVAIPSVGTVRLESHDMFAFLAFAENPLRFFLDPVLAVVNYLDAQGFDRIAMMGLSGGGWTTTVYAAVDQRIASSYPVAGSLPHYLKTTPSDDGWVFVGAGDYEQTLPGLHPTLSYLDLYVLGSIGPGRRQIQVLNKYDPCCYWGTGYRQYEAVVATRVSTIAPGSSFRVFLDETIRTHDVSQTAFALIEADLRDYAP